MYQTKFRYFFFDPCEIGCNTSGDSAGLLHAFTGKKAHPTQVKKEGVKESLKLLQVASKSCGFPIYQRRGMLRLALDSEQKEHFMSVAKEHPGVKFLLPEQTGKILKSNCCYSSIFIEEAFAVDTKNYLLGLWCFLGNHHVTWVKEKVHSLKRLHSFDTIIIAAGAKTAQFDELLPGV